MWADSDPSKVWQPADTSVLGLAFGVGSTGLFLTLALLGIAALEHSQRGKQSEDEATTEASSLLVYKEGDVARPRWRIISLVLIGMSPLASCLVVGENLGVLFAMVAMHWISMLVLPALYFVARSHEEASFAAATLTFCRRVWDQDLAHSFLKSIRGCVFGMPLFVVLIAGYLSFRCKTFSWALCMRSFEQPLEASGFEPHSMPFRLLSALYFTFWNPLIEEFFWRVFLHREVGTEVGVERIETFEMSDAPWQKLWLGILELPATDASWSSAAVRWGVSLMYASYHTWPMKVLFFFNYVGWLHVVAGFLFLVCLGRFFVILRESPDFGLPAAYACHAWVDAAFAVLCLVEIHEAVSSVTQ